MNASCALQYIIELHTAGMCDGLPNEHTHSWNVRWPTKRAWEDKLHHVAYGASDLRRLHQVKQTRYSDSHNIFGDMKFGGPQWVTPRCYLQRARSMRKPLNWEGCVVRTFELRQRKSQSKLDGITSNLISIRAVCCSASNVIANLKRDKTPVGT